MIHDQWDIYVTLSTFGESGSEPIRLLKSSGLKFGVNQTGKRPSAQEVLQNCCEAKVLIAGVEEYGAGDLSNFKRLKCISRCGVGTENIDKVAAEKLGVTILNTPNEPVQAVAEHTVMLMLALLRKIVDLDRDTKAGSWKRHTGNLLQGKVVGLVGYGRIGKKVACLLRPFGVEILAYDPAALAEEPAVKIKNMDELLAKADIVSLHCPPGTAFIGRKEFEKTKKGSWLINTARGDLVDDCALAEALESGQLAGAALDVFPLEPYLGILLSNDKVILTPHQATLTKETRLAMEIAATQNAIEFIKNNK
jgi:D-3-phosphoglycerate dehydrogenase